MSGWAGVRRHRVLVDGYFMGKPYGFGRFIAELCRALGTADTGLDITVVVPSRVDVSSLPAYVGVRWHPAPAANFILWEQVTMPRVAHSLRSDLIHFPYNTRALWTGRLPTVVTVHDLLFLDERRPLARPKDWVVSRYSKAIFRRGTSRPDKRRRDALVAVSDTTRRALGVLHVEATTVLNTVDGFVSDCMPASAPVPSRPYLLHRGGFAEHRNTGRVIEAFKAARTRMGDTVLKIVGAPGGDQLWHTEGDLSIEFLPRLSDGELAAVYGGSVAVVATSLSEGFGLPIIEGFGFGVPVITSDVDPMREIAGDAALLVTPTEVAAIAEAMVSLRESAALRSDLIARGRQRRLTFSSRAVADGMAQVYRAALAR